MAAKEDRSTIRLTLAWNQIVKREAVDLLPLNLRGVAIPTIVQSHEAALLGVRDAGGTEDVHQMSARQVHRRTKRQLKRLRHLILGSYDDPKDPGIAEYGPLGASKNNEENRLRLEKLAGSLVEPFESGEVVLTLDLRPDFLAECAAEHAALGTGTAGATVSRQVEWKVLHKARAVTRETLGRVRDFAKSFFGRDELPSFGFGLPAPATRPRLSNVPDDVPPSET